MIKRYSKSNQICATCFKWNGHKRKAYGPLFIESDDSESASCNEKGRDTTNWYTCSDWQKKY